MPFWEKDGKLVVNALGQPIECDHCPCSVKVGCCGETISRRLVLSVSSATGDCSGLSGTDHDLVYSASDEKWHATLSDLIEVDVWCEEISPGAFQWQFTVRCNGSTIVSGSPFNPTQQCSPFLLQFGQGISDACCGDPGSGAGSFTFEVSAP